MTNHVIFWYQKVLDNFLKLFILVSVKNMISVDLWHSNEKHDGPRK
jgi:hypothetical protein